MRPRRDVLPDPRAAPRAGGECKIDCSVDAPRGALPSQIRADRRKIVRNVRVPSDALRSFTNTCSPRRPQAARRSARFASWCAAPSTRPRRSRRWVRHRLRSASRPGPPPPPRAITRTAGHSVVTRAPAGQDRRRDAHRSASRRSPITRRGATDQPAGARSGRTGKAGRARAPTPSGRLRAARALGARSLRRPGGTKLRRPTRSSGGGPPSPRRRRLRASPRKRRRRRGRPYASPRKRRPPARAPPRVSAETSTAAG